jgi:hypothetical protein
VRVELESSGEVVGDPTEVGSEMRQKVTARGEQQEAAQEALGGDQANDASPARRIPRRPRRRRGGLEILRGATCLFWVDPGGSRHARFS